MTTWIVQTELHSGDRFRNKFVGDIDRRIPGLGNRTYTSLPRSRAQDFAEKVMKEGYKYYGRAVDTFYPANRIKEINVYEQEEQDD